MQKRIIFALTLIASLVIVPTTVQADANDFTISKYDIQYDLSRDARNKSVLRTIEVITADFPDRDQNHGIERYIPKNFDDHSLGTRITSVTDGTGQAWKYTTYDSGKYTVVRIGDKDQYLRGSHTFIIGYEQTNVTKFFANINKQEFYWDTNGTQWRVPIRQLSVKLTVDTSLMDAIDSKAICYQGGYGATNRCVVAQTDNVYKVVAQNLSQKENVTLALGFKKDTFATYQKSLNENLQELWATVQVISILLLVILSIIFWVKYAKISGRKDQIKTIVPEYLPPTGASVPISATLLNSPRSFSAFIVDMAVRHYVQLTEIKEKSFWSFGVYEIKIVKPVDDLAKEEREILRDIFPSLSVGSKVDTKSIKKDAGSNIRAKDNTQQLTDLVRGRYGLRARDPHASKWFRRAALIVLIVAIITLSPAFAILSLMLTVMSWTLWPLTDKGIALYRHLRGLKLYISTAEEERLKILQSPDGAEKLTIKNGIDESKLVKLYERTLPYAILFGQEKEWNKQLGHYYEATGSQPDWYSGAGMTSFNAAAFSSAMSTLTTSIDSSGAAASSIGGSSGGGSSGGGGGGGGGGGW